MPFEDAYNEALNLAREELSAKDPVQIADRTGGSWNKTENGKGILGLDFWAGRCNVHFPSVEIAPVLKLPEQIVVLHYLLHAQGVPLKGNWITFRQIPSGIFYYDPFVKRCLKPFKSTFGNNPEVLEKIRGDEDSPSAGEVGDVSLVTCPLPRIPIAFVIWKGDEEFPPESSILFDETAPLFLPTEDIVVLTGIVTYRLIGRAKDLLK
ncbi:MAG: DUF3786 domain-containing protein [Pseudomonadota bacterium]